LKKGSRRIIGELRGVEGSRVMKKKSVKMEVNVIFRIK